MEFLAALFDKLFVLPIREILFFHKFVIHKFVEFSVWRILELRSYPDTRFSGVGGAEIPAADISYTALFTKKGM